MRIKQILLISRKAKVFNKLALFAIGLFGLSLSGNSYGAPVFYTDFASFDAVTNTTLVEDFEAVTLNTPLSSFTHNGNTYTGLAGTPSPNVFVAAAGFINFGVPVTSSAVLTASGDEDFTVLFGAPGNAVGFDTYLNNSGPADIKVFGGGGLLLGSFSLSHDPTQVGFLGITADENITKIRWTTSNGKVVNTGIDNIRQGSISTTNVPEPAPLALLGFGLMGLGLARRRKSEA